MRKYFCVALLFVLGVASYIASSALVAKSSPAGPAPKTQSQANAGSANEHSRPRIVKSGDTVTSPSAAHIQQIIAERHGPSSKDSVASASVLESEKSVKLRFVLPTNHGVYVFGDATIFDRQISGPYVWNISVTTADGRGVAYWTYIDGAFVTEANQRNAFFVDGFFPANFPKGEYFLNLSLDCLSEPPNIGRLGPVSSKFEIY